MVFPPNGVYEYYVPISFEVSLAPSGMLGIPSSENGGTADKAENFAERPKTKEKGNRF